MRAINVYNFQKAKNFIEEDKQILYSATLGMDEDWKRTSETIWHREDGYLVDLDDPNLKIAGINGSDWATPRLKLEYTSGDVLTLYCYKTVYPKAQDEEEKTHD